MENWEKKCEEFLLEGESNFDSAHDLAHIRRVVANAKRLLLTETAREEVVIPAAWLHDCVTIPKNAPNRHLASRLAAEKAVDFLEKSAYPSKWIPAIAHAITAHSFSAKIPCETIEAKIVQDADRLEALGAIGICRTLMLGGEMKKPLYDVSEALPITRIPDDRENVIDHFYCKLLTLTETMQTAAGKAEAEIRTTFMRNFLEQLAREIQ